MNNGLLKRLKRYRGIYLLIAIVLLYFLVFSYFPLALGIFNSFHDVKLLGGSEFVALDNYIEIINSPQYRDAFVNSIVVGFGTFALQFLWGLLIAVLLYELRNKIARSVLQTVTYIPHILSWSVVGGLWISLLSPTGLVNSVIELFAGSDYTPTIFMAEADLARVIMIFTAAWKGAGYFAALFLAAMVGIDTSLYESASIDGAKRIQQIFYITIPVIVPTMKVVAVLSIMGILRNFDQIFIMMNSSNNREIKNLVVLIYEQGISQFEVGTATAGATVVLLATLLITTITRKVLKYDEIYS